MKALLIWIAICTTILMCAACLAMLPSNAKGAVIMGTLFLVTAMMFLKIMRGSK